jgi:hypothetical protein
MGDVLWVVLAVDGKFGGNLLVGVFDDEDLAEDTASSVYTPLVARAERCELNIPRNLLAGSGV